MTAHGARALRRASARPAGRGATRSAAGRSSRRARPARSPRSSVAAARRSRRTAVRARPRRVVVAGPRSRTIGSRRGRPRRRRHALSRQLVDALLVRARRRVRGRVLASPSALYGLALGPLVFALPLLLELNAPPASLPSDDAAPADRNYLRGHRYDDGAVRALRRADRARAREPVQQPRVPAHAARKARASHRFCRSASTRRGRGEYGAADCDEDSDEDRAAPPCCRPRFDLCVEPGRRPMPRAPTRSSHFPVTGPLGEGAAGTAVFEPRPSHSDGGCPERAARPRPSLGCRRSRP